MRFFCETFFDITSTGVVGHYKSSRVPFVDMAGKNIVDEKTWSLSRNQQRNWETITQLIGMRSQIFEITVPKKQENMWYFEFEVETPDVFGPPDDPVSTLIADCDSVPMLVGLDNKADLSGILITKGIKQNTWFRKIE